MTDFTEQELRELAEEAERTKDEPLSDKATRPGWNRAKVLGVRLNPEEFEELQRYAEARELPASTLVRGWILNQLRARTEGTPEATVERIARDVQQLQRQLSSEGRQGAA